jgi:drug/metabolite transporter (DMT)-like permease
MLLTFYKGASLTHHHHSASSPPGTPVTMSGDDDDHGHASAVRWVLGSVSMLANVGGFAAWLLLQRRLMRRYNAVYSATALMSLLSFVQAAALALSTQRSTVEMWRLRGTVEIIAVVYCGVVASGIGYLMLTYCVEKRGPVFTAAFSPLSQIFVACIDLFFLHEPLYLGRSVRTF